jgi:hypothetical protein
MRLTLCLAALLATAAPALADCVTKDDLAVGVAFKRQDGRRGEIVSTGKGFAISYAAGSQTAWQDDRNTVMGIYETTWAWTPTDEHYVGGGPGGYFEYKLAGKPPVPTPGTNWKTTVKVTTTQDYGLETGPEVTRRTYDAVFSYQAAKEATLSGCPYTIIPVEATFSNKTVHFTRRWIYFPDLGFGLETRFTDHQTGEDRKLGLTALTPM